MAPDKSALAKFASGRIDPKNVAFCRSTFEKFGEENVNPSKFAFCKFAYGPTR